MSASGFSSTGLVRLRALMAAQVKLGRAPGIITGLRRGDEVVVDVIGHADLRCTRPLTRDAIFRITSMTKPITAAAALTLVDDGTLQLDEPVDRLLPELAHRRVLRKLDGPLDDTVPAERPITLRDLLTLRPGFGMIFASAERYPILRAEQELGLRTLGPPTPPTPLDVDEWLRRFGTLPLMHQPGAQWMYNTGSHLLGPLIARAAGQPLADVLRARIFQPLGMTDTGFFVPDADRARLVPCSEVDADTGTLLPFDDDDQWTRPPRFPDAAAGLVSTVDDVLAFGQMLLDGCVGQQRLLSASSLRSMTTNQLTTEQRADAGPVLGGRGWGFGVSLVDDDHPGRFGWDGGFGTSWATDPETGLVAVQLAQVLLSGPEGSSLQDDFWRGVDGAVGQPFARGDDDPVRDG